MNHEIWKSDKTCFTLNTHTLIDIDGVDYNVAILVETNNDILEEMSGYRNPSLGRLCLMDFSSVITFHMYQICM